MTPMILALGAVAVVVGFVVLLVYRAVVSTVATGTGAGVGDHWHAPFKVVVCGERLPPFPAGPGDVHSHGDDVIHIHPAQPEHAGRNASIGTFLAAAPLKVTATSLEAGGKTYKNGDTCSDGRPGKVSVLVNGRAMENFATYTPRDGDQIEFRFGP